MFQTTNQTILSHVCSQIGRSSESFYIPSPVLATFLVLFIDLRLFRIASDNGNGHKNK